MVFIAGKTVWSTPERFKVVCIPCKALYTCSAFYRLSSIYSYITSAPPPHCTPGHIAPLLPPPSVCTFAPNNDHWVQCTAAVQTALPLTSESSDEPSVTLVRAWQQLMPDAFQMPPTTLIQISVRTESELWYTQWWKSGPIFDVIGPTSAWFTLFPSLQWHTLNNTQEPWLPTNSLKTNNSSIWLKMQTVR